jgi:gas vesicle structural protein
MANNGKGVLLISGGADDEVSLLEILDHVLNAGVVIHGSVVISLGGVDLVYLGLNVILTSVETALRHLSQPAVPSRKTPPRVRG